MRYEFRRIDITTLEGLKQTERLQAREWKPVSGYLFAVLMRKEVAK